MAQEIKIIDFQKVLIKALKKWYWFVISCTIIGSLSLLYYFSTTKKYTIDAAIMLRSEDKSGAAMGALSALSALGLGGNMSVDDEIAIMDSRGIMSQAIEELGLQTTAWKKNVLQYQVEYPQTTFVVEYPEHFCDTTERSVEFKMEMTAKGLKVKVKCGRFNSSKHLITDYSQPFESCIGTLRITPQLPIKKGDKFRMSLHAKLPATDHYRKELSIAKMKKESNIIKFSITSECPRRDIDLVNKVIELYNLNSIVDKNILATNTAQFIDERLELITKELYTAEEDVEKYKKENNIADITLDAKRYVEGSTHYQQMIAETETQLNLVTYIQDFINDEKKRYDLIPANIGITDEALIRLITEYNTLLLRRMKVQRTATEDNPVITQLNEQLMTMRQNIIASVSSARQSLVITKRGLVERDNEFNSHIQSVPTQEREYIEIKRRQQMKEQLYLFLFQKREETALMLASSSTPAKMIDVPQRSARHVAPRMRHMALFTLVFGVGLPLGLICLIILLNNNVETRTEYESIVTPPVVGNIVQNSHGRHIAIREGENTVSAELFRLLRTNIRFMLPQHGSSVILVTSAINGEGKSYIATNTAISLAMLGKKVALIGLDIRKPMLAHYFNMDGKGCMTAYLSDDSYSIDDIIIPSGVHETLDLIPAGAIPPNPGELLQESRLDELFVELRKRYDYIVIDSAPIGLISDTFLLDRLSDMTLFVSRLHYTPVSMISVLNQAHEQKRLKNIACVLNGVDIRTAGYGYKYGYGTQKD